VKSRLGALLIVAGVLMVAAALVLFVANQREDQAAGSAATYALVQVVDAIEGAGGARGGVPAGERGGSDARESGATAHGSESLLPGAADNPGLGVDATSTQVAGVVPDPYDPTMTVVEIDGYGYIGCLYIPSLGLELPVMSELDTQRLYVAPCRYTGSTKTDDLVIAAHNYTRHFGKLSWLGLGDEVLFVDMDGVTIAYEVVDMQILGPYDVAQMTSGEYDLTLFTCTYGGASRVTVRCDRVPA